MHPEPRREHLWLQKLIGEWTYETEAREPGKDDIIRMSGTQTIRPIGAVWIQAEFHETTDGEPELSLLTLGFDPERERFVGSFVSAMMASQWVYEGTLDEAANVLTLDTEGMSMADGSRTPFRDIIEVTDADHYVLRSEMQMPDGAWIGFMRMSLSRTA